VVPPVGLETNTSVEETLILIRRVLPIRHGGSCRGREKPDGAEPGQRSRLRVPDRSSDVGRPCQHGCISMLGELADRATILSPSTAAFICFVQSARALSPECAYYY